VQQILSHTAVRLVVRPAAGSGTKPCNPAVSDVSTQRQVLVVIATVVKVTAAGA